MAPLRPLGKLAGTLGVLPLREDKTNRAHAHGHGHEHEHEHGHGHA